MESNKKILVTGGAGYIGSHTVVELVDRGYNVVVVDNLCNSVKMALDRVAQICKLEPLASLPHKEEELAGLGAFYWGAGRLAFYEVNICDKEKMERVFKLEPSIYAVIHFAGLKAVGESVAKPLEYYSNNLTGTLVLLDVMRSHGVKRIVFSSSACVYGAAEHVPVTEDAPLHATNPYGQTKLFLEQILRDMSVADKDASVVLLRYFNPVGAHSSGLIGEDPNGIPNNLMPYVSKVAVGQLPCVNVFGNDYPTPDGTGVRDYIHVVDLAVGHIAALAKLEEKGCFTYNLGVGRGYSVLEMIHAMEKAAGKKIPYKITPRRPGDVAELTSDPSKALRELGWKATRNIDDMCADIWHWQTQNPRGYHIDEPAK